MREVCYLHKLYHCITAQKIISYKSNIACRILLHSRILLFNIPKADVHKPPSFPHNKDPDKDLKHKPTKQMRER